MWPQQWAIDIGGDGVVVNMVVTIVWCGGWLVAIVFPVRCSDGGGGGCRCLCLNGGVSQSE